MVDFFGKNDPKRLLVIDITNIQAQREELVKLADFFSFESIPKIAHANKSKFSGELSDEVLRYIGEVIQTLES